MKPLFERLKEMIFKNSDSKQNSGFHSGASQEKCEEIKKAACNSHAIKHSGTELEENGQ